MNLYSTIVEKSENKLIYKPSFWVLSINFIRKYYFTTKTLNRAFSYCPLNFISKNLQKIDIWRHFSISTAYFILYRIFQKSGLATVKGNLKLRSSITVLSNNFVDIIEIIRHFWNKNIHCFLDTKKRKMHQKNQKTIRVGFRNQDWLWLNAGHKNNI